MKRLLVFIIALAVSRTLEVGCVPVKNDETRLFSGRSLKDDLNDLLKLVPTDKIQDLFYDYLAEDEDFREALDYLMSDDFHNLFNEILSMPEVKELLVFLEESGLDPQGFIAKIKDLLGFDELFSARLLSGRRRNGLPGFIEDIKDLLPLKEIEKMYNEKLKTSKDFAALITRLKSKEFQGLIDKAMANPKLQDLMERAEKKGVDVQKILDFFTSILGIKFPPRPKPQLLSPRSLKDDLNDLLKLVPTDKIQDLFYDYLAEDEDFREALDYLMSDDFHNLFNEILSMPEVKELLVFLEESGLDPQGFIAKIKDLLGFDELFSARLLSGRRRNGLPGFIEDIKDLLPLKEIEKMYNEKLKTSKDFAALITRLKSKEFQGLIDKAMANPKLQDLMERAEKKGVDVQKILDFFTSILGIKFPPRPKPQLLSSRSLKDDIDEFMKLVPSQKIQDIFFQYLAYDQDFAEALDYVMSDEFKSLVYEIGAMPEVLNLVHYLEESGLDMEHFFYSIKKGLGWDSVKRSLKPHHITGGLSGFIKDIIDVLPVKQIEKLYIEKLKVSPDFAKLIRRLGSKEFQGLINKVADNPKMLVLIEKAKAKGVDVQAILKFVSKLLGLKFPSVSPVISNMNLKKDLNDFLSIIPREKIQDIFYSYLSEDEDFRQTLDYFMSEDFQELVKDMGTMTEVKIVINYIQYCGIDIKGFLAKVGNALGHNGIRNSRNYSRISGGLSGFIKDVISSLPVREIEKLYYQKLKTSKEFIGLIQRLSSKEFQALVDRLSVHPLMKDLIKKANDKGVDVQAILDFITSVLGLKFPSNYATSSLFNLKDDLSEFLALVPTNKIEDLFYDYLAEDEDFREALDYIMSNEFKELAYDIGNMWEVIDFINYLQQTGLDVYGFIEKIKTALGFEHVLLKFSSVKNGKITGGLPGFIHDFIDLLPVNKLEKLYTEKINSSKDFHNFINHLKSPDFQNIVDRVIRNPKIQNLLLKAEAKGVDIQAIFDFLSSLLGLRFPQRPLDLKIFVKREEEVIDILRHIWSMVPTDKLRDIIIDYLIEDDDFQKVVRYMLDDDFENELNIIEELEEIKDLLKFLNETGVDSYGYMNQLHSLIGMNKTLPYSDKSLRKLSEIRGGLDGMMQDIMDILPLEELYKYYDEKVDTNRKFKEWVKRMNTQEVQLAVNALGKNDGFQKWLDELEKMNLDVQQLAELIGAVTGIKFPNRPNFLE